MSDLHSISDLIALWPTLGSFAVEIGVLPNSAKQMKRRGSIAVRHWPAVVAAAKQRGYRITTDTLVRLHVHEERAA